MGMKSTVQVIVFFRRKLQLVYAVTQMEGVWVHLRQD